MMLPLLTCCRWIGSHLPRWYWWLILILYIACTILYTEIWANVVFPLFSDRDVYYNPHLSTGLICYGQAAGGNTSANTDTEYFSYYVGDQYRHVTGSLMAVDRKHLEACGYPMRKFIRAKDITKMKRNLTFVTAISSNHFNEAIDGIASVQQHFPSHRIILYDLGLDEKQVAELSQFCSVEHRQFPFSEFPHWVSQLSEYRWKPVIIYMTLQEFNIILWMDASLRIVDIGQFEEVMNKLSHSAGFLYFYTALFHPPSSFTNPAMYDYLPMDDEFGSSIPMLEANTMLFANTREVHDRILQVSLVCALDARCMAPPGSYVNSYYSPHITHLIPIGTWSGSHLYDQSAFHIVVSNHYQYRVSLYYHPPQGWMQRQFLVIRRGITAYYTIRTCPTTHASTNLTTPLRY